MKGATTCRWINPNPPSQPCLIDQTCGTFPTQPSITMFDPAMPRCLDYMNAYYYKACLDTLSH